MCRHLAWLGEPCSVASLVLDPPYGLLVQSYSPRRQKHGLMNADGWGVGFFDNGVARRWRSAAPMWGDTSFASVAPASVAAVAWWPRCARPPSACRSNRRRQRRSPTGSGCSPTTASSTAPCCRLSPKAESTVDSALLAALIFDRGLDALGDTIVEVAAADPNARLNILAANGTRLLATTWGDTLSVLRRDDGVVLSSEPYDDNPEWQEIPDRHLVEVVDSRVELIPLKGSS